MQLSCLYHPTQEMIVTDDEDHYNKLIASGVWFDHPTKAKNMRNTYEEQIRQQPKQRRSKSKCALQSP